MSARTAFLVVALSASALAVSSCVHAATGGGRAGCSEATARQLIDQHQLNNFLVPSPVGQVLCGPFVGAGSDAMAVTIANAPTCWGVQRWAVFNFTGGTWQLVLDQSAFIFPPIVAVGGDLRVTTPVFRAGDPRCIPSGGSHAQTWHWNGASFTAGPYTQVTPGKVVKKEAIVLAAHGACHLVDDGSVGGSWVYCWLGFSTHPSRHVKLDTGGRFSVSATTPVPLGLGGRTTPEGTKISLGRFSCRPLRTGIKCTLISTGRGFLFGSNGATRAVP